MYTHGRKGSSTSVSGQKRFSRDSKTKRALSLSLLSALWWLGAAGIDLFPPENPRRRRLPPRLACVQLPSLIPVDQKRSVVIF